MLAEDKQKNIIRQKMIAGWRQAHRWSMVWLLLAVVLGLAVYHHWKVLPEGLDWQSEERIVNLSDIKFLKDQTYQDKNKQTVIKQEIFDNVFQFIDAADQYILVDMFLFNYFGVTDSQAYRSLCQELTDKLVAKKQAKPDIRIDFITDPINTVYGGLSSPQIKALQQAGVNVIITDLKPLRDSNFFYSGWWRLVFSWWGNSSAHGWLTAPFKAKGKVNLRSYFALLNFKANHRKVFLADNSGRLAAVVASANPHDGSSRHANVAISVKGQTAEALYQSETMVAQLSAASLNPLPENLLNNQTTGENKYAKVRVVTENKIAQAALTVINQTQAEDKIYLAMFYLSDRRIIKALVEAAERGVITKIILDPNRDAFGYEKNGIPNRPVAAELLRRSDNKIAVRWSDTHGEQFHTKMLIVFNNEEQTADLLLGSANFTKRNLNNFNLETDLWLTTRQDLSLAQEVKQYFENLWSNGDGNYTVDYEKYQDESWPLFFTYWLQETTGLSSF